MNPHRFCGKIIETGINKGSCYLACSIGPEIKEDDAVPILHQPVTIHHSRLEELIILASRVAVFHCDLCRLCPVARAIRQAPVGFLDPIPALVPVHGVVAAAYRRHLARAYLLEFRLQLPEIGQGTPGRDIPAIQNGVHINVLKIQFLGHLQECIKVSIVAVHAPV